MLAFCCAALGARADSALVADSPFSPSGTASAAAGASAPAEAYELAGSSVQGNTVVVCIFDRQAKHSAWIGVGETAGGIHVLSFDAQRDRAVVTISGTRKELGLRKATYGAAGPQPLPHPTAAVAVDTPPPVASPAEVPKTPVPPTVAEHDQQEARMLVSDLLEIGIQQRKAYQEAKQKAASQPSPVPSN